MPKSIKFPKHLNRCLKIFWKNFTTKTWNATSIWCMLHSLWLHFIFLLWTNFQNAFRHHLKCFEEISKKIGYFFYFPRVESYFSESFRDIYTDSKYFIFVCCVIISICGFFFGFFRILEMFLHGLKILSCIYQKF